MPKPRVLGTLNRQDVVNAMANASSIAEAARTLGVDKGSVSRWVAAGKVPAPGAVRRRKDAPKTPAADVELTPQAWVAALHKRNEFGPAELQLVDLAAIALQLARDETQRPTVRLQASARFAALVAQLNLPAEPAEDTQTHGSTQTFRSFPRRA